VISRAAALLLAAALFLAACSSTDSDTGSSGETTTPTPQASAETAASEDSTSESTTSESTAPETTMPQESTPTTNDGSCRPVAGVENEPGQQDAVQIELQAADNTYPVRLYIPGDSPLAAAADGRYPVVLNWHGLGSDGFQQALLTNYETLAEAEGFMVVHPTGAVGSATADGQGPQTGWELAPFDVPGRDDLAMAEALIDRVVSDYCADPDRVYSTGLSNGGFFTSRLVCELADRIAAAVTVAGVAHPDDCSPSRAVAIMAFHGTADGIVPFDGGPSALAGSDAPPELVEFFEQVMPDELAAFATDFDCEPEPEITPISDEVIAYDYPNCADDVAVRFIEINDGGHTWPGSFLGAFMTEALGPTTTDVSATSEGWRFMSRYSLDQ